VDLSQVAPPVRREGEACVVSPPLLRAPVPPVPGAAEWSRAARPRRTSAGRPAVVPPARSARYHRGPAAARNPASSSPAHRWPPPPPAS